MSIKTTTIIGAGLSGLSLALHLAKHGITITVYELRPESSISEGAVMLSPNSFRSDAISLYSRIQDKGYHFRDLYFNTNEHKTIDKYEMGNAEKYGVDAMRVYRQTILSEMKAMAKEAGIKIHYGKKFSHVLAEDDDRIRFAFTDGEEAKSDLLIGADGIHSSVRKYLYPELKPDFSKFMAITAAIPTKNINFPFEGYPLPAGIHSDVGAFIMAPNSAGGSETLAGIQYQTEERDRAGWDALWEDKQKLLAMVREKYDYWNPMVKSAMDAIPIETLTIWPFYTVPKLERWSSDQGRVVLIGDCAHAIPPAAGQGVNQAFEDVHALSLLVGSVNEGGIGWMESLTWWQKYRQERIVRVAALTNEMNKRRMPGWNGEGAEGLDSSWLFGVDVRGDVRSWLEEQKSR